MRICFWQSDLLLFGQGLRLLAICRFAWGSLTSLRWRMRELARAAIFPALTLPPPHQPLAARWRPGVGGYRGPPPCPLTQGDGAPLREGVQSGGGGGFGGRSGATGRKGRKRRRRRKGGKARRRWREEGWIRKNKKQKKKPTRNLTTAALDAFKCPSGCLSSGLESGSALALTCDCCCRDKSLLSTQNHPPGASVPVREFS